MYGQGKRKHQLQRDYEQLKDWKTKLETYQEHLEIMGNYKNSIAVSGSHGKSTTTSMISKILMHSDKDATILLGGELEEMKGNVRVGSEEYLVTEACEYKGNIRYYYPQTLIVLNIDEDHLDYYKDLEDIVNTFKEYLSNQRFVRIDSRDIMEVAIKNDENSFEILF